MFKPQEKTQLLNEIYNNEFLFKKQSKPKPKKSRMVAKSPAVVGSFGTKLSVGTNKFGRKSQNKKITKEHKYFEGDSLEGQERINGKK